MSEEITKNDTQLPQIEEPKKQKKTADIKEYRKNYYRENKEKLTEKRNQKKHIYHAAMNCDICGGKYRKHLHAVHANTKKHITAVTQKQTIANLQMQLNEAKKICTNSL